MIDFIKEKIELQNKEDVLKLHLSIKCRQHGINVSEADLDSLVEMYYTGYGNPFIKNCVKKDFFKSEQTVRNAITRMTALGIIIHKKRGERHISKEFVPDFKSDKIIVQYLVGNLK